MKKLSLQNTLISAFIFLTLIVLVVGTIGLLSNNRLGSHIDTIGKNAFPSIFNLGKVNQGQTAAEAAFFAQSIPSNSGTQKQQELKKLQDALAQVDEGFAEYEKLPRDPEENKIYIAITPAWQQWKNSMNQLIKMNEEFRQYNIPSPAKTLLELANQGKINTPEYTRTVAAFQLVRKMDDYISKIHRPYVAEATNQMQKLLNYNQGLANNALQKAESDMRVTTFWAIVGIMLGLATSIFFGFV
ncbi:MCP four helix bundle domain-containing protein, partial [Planktothrix sp. FACHB-1355]